MKSTKKILGASAALGLAVALSAGSTFAWFAVGNKEVKVNRFTLNATTSAPTSDTLYIGLSTLGAAINETNYGFSNQVVLPADDASKKDGYGLKNGLTPLTVKLTEDGDENIVWNDDASYNKSPKFFSDNDCKVAADLNATDGMAQFSLVFKSSASMKIYLDASSYVKPDDTAAGKNTYAGGSISYNYKAKDAPNYFVKDIIGGTYGEGYFHDTDKDSLSMLDPDDNSAYQEDDITAQKDMKIKARAANASRVMFVSTSDSNTRDGRVWCPNEALYAGGTYISTVSKDNDKCSGFYQNNLAGAYNLFKVNGANADLSSVLDQKAYGMGVKPLATSETSAMDETCIAETKQATETSAPYKVDGYTVPDNTYYYAVVEVYIWLEGTDGDCFEAIVKDAMEIALNFRAL